MLFDPINSVTNLDFYKKVAAQSLGRSFLYVCYLAALFSLLCTLALKLKVGPVIDETFRWLERSVPAMTYANGRVTAASQGPVRLQHPTLPEVSLLIDTSRSEAVTPQQMEKEKVLAYLTATAFYLREQNGDVRVFDLTRSALGSRPVQIDAGFFRNAAIVMGRVLYPAALIVTFLLFLAWKLVASAAYSLVALMINALSNGSLGYPALLNISVYAQTLVVGLQGVSLFLPFGIPGFSLLCVVITGAYLWLAVKRHSPAPASA